MNLSSENHPDCSANSLYWEGKGAGREKGKIMEKFELKGAASERYIENSGCLLIAEVTRVSARLDPPTSSSYTTKFSLKLSKIGSSRPVG